MKRHNARTEPPNNQPLPARLPRRGRVSLLRCLLLACMLAGPSAAFAVDPVAVDIAVKSLKDSRPPHMVGEVLVLSLKPDPIAWSVGVRFAHESWQELHRYAKNENGVFVLDYPVPEGVREIRYRIVVDGLWMADPANPRVDTDATGNEFSVYTLEKEPVRPIVNPRRETDGSLTFTFRGTPGRRVSIVGDFNNWDPFMDPLQETAPGTYAVTLRVPPGRHWYYYFSDGRRMLDMFNAGTGVDPDGTTVSYFSGAF